MRGQAYSTRVLLLAAILRHLHGANVQRVASSHAGDHSNAGSHDPSAGHASSNVVQLVVDSLVGSAGLQRLHAARFSFVTRVQTRGRRDGLVPDERTARLQRLTVSSATHSLVFARDIDDDVDLCPDTPQVRVLSYRTTHEQQLMHVNPYSLTQNH